MRAIFWTGGVVEIRFLFMNLNLFRLKLFMVRPSKTLMSNFTLLLFGLFNLKLAPAGLFDEEHRKKAKGDAHEAEGSESESPSNSLDA